MNEIEVNDCLVMVISKYPIPGKVKTRLAPSIGLVAAADVFRAMLLDLLDHHRNSPYDVIIETTGIENLETFKKLVGEFPVRVAFGDDLRGTQSILYDAFNYHCNKYRKVIALYADTPFVDSHLVLEGFKKLECCDIVLGPCVNGGYYLIGMSQPIDLFTSHEKGRFPYYEKTIRLIKDRGLSYQLLDSRYDIDTVDDIKAMNWDSTSGTWSRTLSLLTKLRLLNVTFNKDP